MDSRFLNKKGISILEITLVVFMVGMLCAMIIAGCKIRVDKANFEKTVDEMMSIAQASWDYYNSQGNWPVTSSDLAATYMNAVVTFSPFGHNYLIKGQSNGQSNMVTVSTAVPTGLAESYYQGTLLQVLPGVPMDTIEITQQLSNGFSGRLEYEKKYRYTP